MSSKQNPVPSGGDLTGSTGPLHQSVAEALRARLAENEIPGGSKLPPLRQMAREFNVSTMTVRQAIRILEDEKRVYRIAGVGAFVRPRQPAKGPAQDMLAFVGSDLGSTFQGAIARGVQKASQKHGWAIQLLDAHFDAKLEARNIKRLPASGVRGAIVLPPLSDSGAAGALARLQSADFSLVLVDQTTPGLRADLVASDHEAGAYRATQYLVVHGHSQILMLTHPAKDSSSVAARIHGYDRALRSSGQEPLAERKVWINLKEHQAGYREGRKWFGGCRAITPLLERLKPPLAVLAIDAYTGWGVYEACRKLGLRVPDDVSVVAFDDAEVAHAISPPMTTISQHTDEIGRTAVDLLTRRADAGHADDRSRRTFTHVVIDVDLIERQSVASVGRR